MRKGFFENLKSMNEDIFNREKIETYLLGASPEAEAERFDEMSFTDDDFADALKAAEADLIDRYVNNDLRGATLERFESFYLASPLRREKIEFARRLQTFAEREIIATKSNFAAEKEESKNGLSKFFSSLNIFKNQNTFLQFGFAAAALLVLILGGLWILTSRSNQTQIAKQDQPANFELPTPKRIEVPGANNSEIQTENSNSGNKNLPANVVNNLPSNQIEKEKTKKQANVEPARTPKPKEAVTPPKITIASFLLLPSLRGGSKIQSVSIDQNVTDAAVQLRLEADDYPSYRIQLIDQSNGKSLWQSGTVKAKSAGANKQLNISFPAKLLKSQIYALQISGVTADGNSEIISDYPFRVVR